MDAIAGWSIVLAWTPPGNNTGRAAVKIAYITAGAAGMYCGNCLRDHSLAVALRQLGEKVTLVPIYTPLLTDLESGAELKRGPVFFNGLRAYLEQHVPYLREPRPVIDRIIGSRPVDTILSRIAVSTEASRLGPMTHSMLLGEEGNQRKEIEELLSWLKNDLQPDIVHISNLLLIGMARRFKEVLKVPVVCSMQSEDHFIEALPEPHREGCVAEIRSRAREVDGLVAVSEAYRASITEKYDLDEGKVSVILPGIPLEGHGARARGKDDEGLRLGYFARICPEKGLDKLCQAFSSLALDGNDNLSLRVGGYLPRSSEEWLEGIASNLERAGLADRAELLPTLTRAEKLDFLSDVDIFSVPAQRPESKGLYALEAMASEVPVVLPDEGVFPELIEKGGGGFLYDPADRDALKEALGVLVSDPELRKRLGREGRESATQHFSAERMAKDTLGYYRELT